MRINLFLLLFTSLAVVISTPSYGLAGDDFLLPREPKMKEKSVLVDLRRVAIDDDFGEISHGLEFSADSKQLCFWWVPRGGTSGNATMVLMDMKGKVVRDPASVEKALWDENLAAEFSETSWDIWGVDLAGWNRCWAFDGRSNHAIRLVQTADRKFMEAELWRTKPYKERIWNVKHPSERVIHEVQFLKMDMTDVILGGYSGSRVLILDRVDGHVVESFRSFQRETHDEMEAYRKKYGLTFVSDGEPMLRFSPKSMALEPTKKLIAYGASYGRQIRIVSLDPPRQMIREINPDESPFAAGRRIWSVQNLRFCGGNFLVARYVLEGSTRATSGAPTEILDTRTWRVVWREKSTDIGDVCLSPDGKRIAFLRKQAILEIGPFVPNVE